MSGLAFKERKRHRARPRALRLAKKAILLGWPFSSVNCQEPGQAVCRRRRPVKPRRPRIPLPNKPRDDGSGTPVVMLDDPCMETKPSINVEPSPEAPLKVIVAGKVRPLICVVPRLVLEPFAPTIEHPLKSDVAPPLTWHEALLAIPVLFCPLLWSVNMKLLPISLNTTYFCVPAPMLPGWLRRGSNWLNKKG